MVKITGVLVCFVVAIISWLLGQIFPIIGGPVFGILLGMIITLFFSRISEKLKEGATYSGKKLLQLSVILLGFEMNIFQVFKVGSSSLIVMLFTLTVAFASAWYFGRQLKVNATTTTLIGVGTAICGGSAIAATAPVINAKDDEIAHAISTIFLFNIVAVFIFPAIGHFFNMSDIGFGIWAGTAINDTSSVLAASYSYSDHAGNLATIVKLTRTLMIIPITFFLSIYIARTSSQKSKFSFSKAFPWFVIGFVLAALLNTSNILPVAITQWLALSGKFLIVVAMVGIGLNTHLIKLLKNGIRPILLGLFCWISLAAVSLLVQYWIGLV